jgi:hypothetical protein
VVTGRAGVEPPVSGFEVRVGVGVCASATLQKSVTSKNESKLMVDFRDMGLLLQKEIT